MHPTLDALKADEILGDGIVDWMRKTKTTNMSMERLLNTIFKSSPLKNSLIERLCASGLLTQVLHDHLMAGGRDPRCNKSAKRLRSEGVPIGTKSKERCSNASMCRGLFAYLSETVPLGSSKADRRAACVEAAARFASLPDDQKLIYKSGEEMAAMDRSSPPDDVNTYDRDIGDKLFGMSSQEQPLTETVAIEVIDAMLGGDKSCLRTGMRNYVPRCRDDFCKGMYVTPSG